MARIRPMKFVHVVYRTFRFEQMVRWYQLVFDAKVQYQNPALAFLTYDREHHRFAFANMDLLKPEDTERDRREPIGVDHVAYTYASPRDLLENYAQLKAQRVTPYWCVHHGITVSMDYADPDRNQLEFQVDCFGSNDEANAFMAGPHFVANPIGVESDPDDWLARLRAGTSASEFLMRRTHEPASPVRGSFADESWRDRSPSGPDGSARARAARPIPGADGPRAFRQVDPRWSAAEPSVRGVGWRRDRAERQSDVTPASARNASTASRVTARVASVVVFGTDSPPRILAAWRIASAPGVA